MASGKTCGRCQYFLKVKGWGNTRNGLCEKYDYNVNSDGTYAQKCDGYKSIKYKRRAKI